MTKTGKYIRVVLKDFEECNGRKPKTIEEYRWIGTVAREMSAIEAAWRLTAEGPPDVDFSNLCPPGTVSVYFSPADVISASEDIEWNEA